MAQSAKLGCWLTRLWNLNCQPIASYFLGCLPAGVRLWRIEKNVY